MTLDDLVANLERVTAGSRELDDAVWAIAVNGYEVRWREGRRPEFRVPACGCRASAEGGAKHEPDGSHWQAFELGNGGPGYTQDIGAAFKIMPSDWAYEIYHDDPRFMGDRRAYCIFAHPKGRDPQNPRSPRAMVSHDNLAVALCIAALKAIAANQERA